MDIDILSSEVKTKKYTYFGTYFTHENYHRRLANRKLPMEKPNNGWVLQGCRKTLLPTLDFKLISLRMYNLPRLFSLLGLFWGEYVPRSVDH